MLHNLIPENSKLERELRSVERSIKHERKARKTLIRHANFFAELESKSSRLFYSISSSDVLVYPYLDVSGFTAESAPELFNFLEWLEDTLTFSVCRDLPDQGEREYIYQGPGFRVILTASFNEADTCKRVIVGMKKSTVSRLVEVEVDTPVYEFQC